MNSNWQIPQLGDPPQEYNKEYMSDLIRSINVLLEEMKAPGDLLVQEVHKNDGTSWVNKFVKPVNLDSIDSPADREMASYDSATGNFEWLPREFATPLDYGAVGDGVANDTTAVQNALDNNDTVHIPDGYTFTVSPPSGSNSLTLNTNQVIFGGGTIKQGSNGNTFQAGGKSNIKISGITIDGSGATSSGNIFLINSCGGISIQHCTLTDAFNNAISSDETIYFNYSNNFIQTVGNHGISLSGDAAGGAEHNYGTVSNNLILDADASGINASESAHVSIVGNYVRYTGTHTAGNGGIRVSNESVGVAVVGNTVVAYSRGIFLIEAFDCSVVGNTLKDSRLQGILIDDSTVDSFFSSVRNTVVGNTILTVGASGTTSSGIQIDDSDDNLIAGNIIRSASNMDIGVEESNGSTGNLIYGNRVSGASSSEVSYLSSEPLFMQKAQFENGGSDLDWYEESTWTPTLSGKSTAGAATYTDREGYFTRVGNIVLFQCRISWTAHTGSGGFIVTGLPYTPASDSYDAVAIRITGVALGTDGSPQAFLDAGNNRIELEYVPDGGGGAVDVPVDASGTVLLSGRYRV